MTKNFQDFSFLYPQNRLKLLIETGKQIILEDISEAAPVLHMVIPHRQEEQGEAPTFTINYFPKLGLGY